MKKVLYFALLLSLLFIMAACGGNKEKTPKADGDLVYRPAWWSEQNEADYVCTYGQGTNLSETSSMNTAKANALLEASQYVETEVQGMIKRYEEEAGVYDPQLLALSSSVVKAVSNARFSGAITGKVETRKVNENGGQRFKTWMQVKIPKGDIQKNVMTNIRNEEALYNQFKASQAFQELEQEIEKY